MCDSNHTSKANGQYKKVLLFSSVVSEARAGDTKLELSEYEEALIARMFSLVGERWSLIAGRIPARTAEDIQKYWTAKGASSGET